MTAPRRWWREPALHFVLLGAGVFALDAWRRPKTSPRDVEVSASYVRGLREEHQRRYGRAPTADELRAEVDRFVREEVLYREALRLGLERGDLIVRRRLVQKMEFFLEDVAPPTAPTDDTLRAYLDAHRDRYAQPPRVTLRHVFLDRGRRGDHLAADAASALEALRNGADPATVGDPFVSGSTFTDVERDRIAGDLGDDFARALDGLPTERWAGPVASTYGLHLVRVSARSPGRAQTLGEVRERVLNDWRSDDRERANREAWRRVADGYHVRVEGL
jgi:peptidyl-prolyl cis-trans isomerase C